MPILTFQVDLLWNLIYEKCNDEWNKVQHWDHRRCEAFIIFFSATKFERWFDKCININIVLVDVGYGNSFRSFIEMKSRLGQANSWPSQLRSLGHFLNKQLVHHWRFEDKGSHPNCLCIDYDRIRICNFWYRWFEQELKTFGRLDDCLWLVPRPPNHRFDTHYPDLKIFNLTNFVIFAIIAISSTFDEFCNFLWFREIVDLVIFPEFSIVFKFVNFCDFLWFYEFYDFLEFDDLPSGIGMKLATCNAGKTCEFIGLFKRSKAKSE